MRKLFITNFTLGILAILVILCTAGFASAGGVTIENAGDAVRITGINDFGQITGYSQIPTTGIYPGFFYSSGTGRQAILGNLTAYTYGLSNDGTVAGWAYVAGNQDGVHHAFTWKNGVIKDLGTLDGSGFGSSEVGAINKAGVVVGRLDTFQNWNDQSPMYAFKYSNNQMTSLGALPTAGGPGFMSNAYALNDVGQVAGVSRVGIAQTVEPFNSYNHAVIFQPDGSVTDLGTFGTPFNQKGSEPTSINNRGQVVGNAETNELFYPSGHPALYTGHAFIYSNGVMSDLGTFGGKESNAVKINDAGQVIGWAQDATGAGHGFLYKDGKMIDLGGVGLNDINNEGQIIGTDANGHAFVYCNGIFLDLNTLLPADSGWLLTSAQKINDNGQIAGIGIYNGVTEAFLLSGVPNVVPLPPSLFFLGSGLVGLAGVRRFFAKK